MIDIYLFRHGQTEWNLLHKMQGHRDIPLNETGLKEAKNLNKKELNEFLEGLNSQQFQKLIKFFQTMPKLSHTLKYKCNTCGTDDELLLEGLKSFFL